MCSKVFIHHSTKGIVLLWNFFFLSINLSNKGKKTCVLIPSFLLILPTAYTTLSSLCLVFGMNQFLSQSVANPPDFLRYSCDIFPHFSWKPSWDNHRFWVLFWCGSVLLLSVCLVGMLEAQCFRVLRVHSPQVCLPPPHTLASKKRKTGFLEVAQHVPSCGAAVIASFT